MSFVGRQVEIDRLSRVFSPVTHSGEGTLLSIRGRRQVGKSRLVEEFLRRTECPSLFFAAARGAPAHEEVRAFTDQMARSSLEAANSVEGATFDRWEPVLRVLASNTTTPSILVLDELPFLIEGDSTLEGALQRVWDRALSRVPILMIVIGSDLSMMESLGRYDRPLYQRMQEMIVEPLNVTETADMLHLDPADALDAHLVHGGFPTLARAWEDGDTVVTFLARQLIDSTSPLVVAGERILNTEFPPGLQARTVLQAIGSGQTTFTALGNVTGLNQGSLNRSLQTLTEKRVIAVERPISAKPSRNALYRIADPYLRFWLRFIGPNFELLLRDRGDVLTDEISQAWNKYRGRSIEPIIRVAIERLLPDERFGDARYVGSFWTRTGDTEVDLVGARDATAPTAVSFVGSIKWRERHPFDRRDRNALAAASSRVPGAEGTRLVGVSRAGFEDQGIDVALGPDDIVSAWRHE